MEKNKDRFLEVGKEVTAEFTDFTTEKTIRFKFRTYQKEYPGKATLSMQNKM